MWITGSQQNMRGQLSDDVPVSRSIVLPEYSECPGVEASFQRYLVQDSKIRQYGHVNCRSEDINTVSCGICVPKKRILDSEWCMTSCYSVRLYTSLFWVLIAINMSACRHWAYCIDRLPGSWLIPGYAALKGCPVLQTSDRSGVTDVEVEEEGLIGTWKDTHVSRDLMFLCRIQ